MPKYRIDTTAGSYIVETDGPPPTAQQVQQAIVGQPVPQNNPTTSVLSRVAQSMNNPDASGNTTGKHWYDPRMQVVGKPDANPAYYSQVTPNANTKIYNGLAQTTRGDSDNIIQGADNAARGVVQGEAVPLSIAAAPALIEAGPVGAATAIARTAAAGPIVENIAKAVGAPTGISQVLGDAASFGISMKPGALQTDKISPADLLGPKGKLIKLGLKLFNKTLPEETPAPTPTGGDTWANFKTAQQQGGKVVYQPKPVQPQYTPPPVTYQPKPAAQSIVKPPPVVYQPKPTQTIVSPPPVKYITPPEPTPVQTAPIPPVKYLPKNNPPVDDTWTALTKSWGKPKPPKFKTPTEDEAQELPEDQ